jgi:hypothetical protein
MFRWDELLRVFWWYIMHLSCDASFNCQNMHDAKLETLLFGHKMSLFVLTIYLCVVMYHS